MELRKCRNGHDMRLIEVHLKGVGGVAAYSPSHGPGGLQLVKIFKCGLCDQEDEVKEEIQ